MWGKIYKIGNSYFVKDNNIEYEILEEEELDITDNNRNIEFDVVNEKAKITHKYPKEHGLDWLVDSSEYPSEN